MKTATLNDYKARLRRVLAHIQTHLDEALPLRELAGLACLSPHHFHRVFSGMIGESLAAHIRRLRLERAAWQLQTDTEPVTEIAFAAGYDTPEAFSRAFTRHYHHAPSAFRRSPQARPLLPAPSGIHFLPTGKLTHFRTQRPTTLPALMNATIKTIAPIRVASLRHTGPYADCGPTWETLLETLGAEGHLGPGTRLLGIAHDDPEVTPPEQIRYDAGVTIADDYQPTDGITVQHIPGGDYAVITHQGPYDQLAATYQELVGRWVPRSGRELADAPCFEEYLNDPNATEPEELLTDIYAPLA